MDKLIYFKTLAILMACLALALPANAYDFVKDGIYYNINGNGTSVSVTYKDTNYNSYSGTVNIPATVTYNETTYNVTSIGVSAFNNCTDLIRVVIPNSVQYIMNYAFQNCTGLINITLPASLSAVYNNVFSGCTSLKSIICLKPNPGFCTNTNNFPTSVYSDAKLIVPQGYMSNYQSSSLWSNFSTIEEMDCDFAVDAIFYKDLGDNKAEVTYPNSSYTYFSNYYTGDVVIPSTVTHGGKTYTVTAIHPSTFYYCHYLSSVSIPTTVSSIGIYAFYDCTSLTSCTIPEGVESIEYCTFGNCSQLSSVVIPSSVNWIAQNVFVNCNALTSITCRATTPPICTDSSCFPTAAYSNATLYVPDNAVSQYQSASVWQNFSNIVGKSYDFESNGIYYRITGTNTAEVTYKDLNFNSYSGLVRIPSTVTHEGTVYTVTAIGASAFRQSSGLTGVTIPGSVTVIDYAAFYNCTALTQITIYSTLRTIGDYAFRQSGLTSIYIPYGVQSIGRACFYGCSALTSATIPGSVQSLGELCFMRCESLQNVSFGQGFTEIPLQCFTYCTDLNSITIPSSVKKYDHYSFYNTGFTSLDLSEGVDTIGYRAFGACLNLTSISFPASVRFIDEAPLEECPSLAEITVDGANPNYSAVDNVLYDKQQTRLIRYAPQKTEVITQSAYNCTTIDDYAFEDATNLLYCVIGPNLSYVGTMPFFGCTSLTSFIMPAENPHFMLDYDVLYSKKADGQPQSLICYPAARPDKHYSVLNGTDSIRAYAFDGTSALQSAYLPQGLDDLGAAAFYRSQVKRVVIDEGLQTINHSAFAYCDQLESLYLPSTLETIGDMALLYTDNLSEITFAGATPPTIIENAFYDVGFNVANGTRLYVPAGSSSAYASHNWNASDFTFNVAEISPLATGTEFTVDSLIYKTTDAALSTTVTDVINSNIVDPGISPKVAYQGNLCTVASIDNYALYGCSKMVRAEVPFSVKTIGNYAFYNCLKVDKTVLHEGVQRIGGYAFAHMHNLGKIWIPASVDSIRSDAFIVDPLLYGIYVKEGNTRYTSIDAVLYTKDGKRLVSFPEGKTTYYTVPDGTEVISSEAFRGNVSLTSITMPNSLRKIEGYAFYGCTALPDIEVPNGVTTIENYAFYNCSSLTSADLPATLTSLGYSAFVGANGLTTLTVRATTPPTCEFDFTHEPFSEAQYSSVQLIVPRGSAQAYRQATIWKKFQNITEADFPGEFIRGDLNGDGAVGMDDLTLLINYLLTGDASSINLPAADTNEDGPINMDDLTVLINYLLTNEWPAPKGIDMWYLWGNFFGSNIWGYETGEEALGVSVLPMYPDGEFDSQGKGTLTWSGHVPRGYFTILHEPGNIDEGWGVDNQGNYVMGSFDDPDFSSFLLNDGYYTITLNTKTMTLNIEPYLSTVYTFQYIAMPGYFNGWVTTEDIMTPVNTGSPAVENHDWYVDEFTLTSDGELKFAADGDWSFNWGTDMFPYGQGENGGLNIPVKAGTYKVFFNDMTGHYHFIAK